MGAIEKTVSGYRVESTSRKGQFYEVDLNKPSCSCPAFRFQAMRKGGVCKHVDAVQRHAAAEHKDVHAEVIAFLKTEGETDSITLIERFGEEAVNALLQQGQLTEERGKIRLLE